MNMKREMSAEKGHPTDETKNYRSFSIDFNDVIEHKKRLESVYEDALGEGEEEKEQDSSDDEFYDAN